MSKKKIIDIDAHSFLRMLKRSTEFGIDFYDIKQRAFETVRFGKLAKRKHLSKKYNTYYQYFNDNLSFYVICKKIEKQDHIKCFIKTVIIEQGRE